MCCRYWTDESPEIRGIVGEMNRSPLMGKWRTPPVTSGEVRPADVAPVIASSRTGSRSVYPMRWGFGGKNLLINARVETAPVRPTFREAWAAHRCIIPASCYFEWEHPADPAGKKKTGSKYRIYSKNSAVTWMCGLYRIEEGLPVFVVLTREPGEGIRFIHDRMPLILPERLVGEWIRPEASPEELAGEALCDLVYEKAE